MHSNIRQVVTNVLLSSNLPKDMENSIARIERFDGSEENKRLITILTDNAALTATNWPHGTRASSPFGTCSNLPGTTLATSALDPLIRKTS